MSRKPSRQGESEVPRGAATGRRLGRPLRPGQKRLLDDLLPRLEVSLPAVPHPGAVEPAALFDFEPSAIWLEIGFGNGEHLVWQARQHPDVGLIGAEIFLNGVAALLKQVEEQEIGNIRVLPDDVWPLLEALPEACLARVFLLFPDPWPKARHHKRRFIQTGTLDLLARVMADGAELRVASDDPGYQGWAVEHLQRHPDFAWTARRPGDWRRRPDDWPPTRYEQKLLAGRQPVFLSYRRRARGAGN